MTIDHDEMNKVLDQSLDNWENQEDDWDDEDDEDWDDEEDCYEA